MTVSAADSRHGRAEAQALAHGGDLPGAEARLGELITLLDDGDEQARREAFRCHTDRALLRRIRNDWDGAITDLEAADGLIGAMPPFIRRQEEAGLWHARAKLSASRADIRRDPDARRADRREARRCLDEVRQRGWVWQADEIESSLAQREKDWGTAATCAERAAAAIRAQGWLAGTAMLERRQGEALLELGDLRAADPLAHALTFFDQNGPPDELARAEMAMARLSSLTGEHDDAWARAVRSLDLSEGLVRRFRSLDQQQRYLADKAGLYESAYRVALAPGGEGGILRAWTVAERAKSFYLCQLLAGADVGVFEGVDPGDLARLRALEEQLDLLDLGAEIPGGQADETARAAVSDERLRLLDAMIAANPRWGSLRIPPPLDVGAEIGRLGADWIPLSLFWHSRDDAGETLTVFWIDRDRRPRHSERRWTTEELAELDDRRERLRNLVPAFDAIVPVELAQKIVPVALWGDLAPSARLLISPHGRLRGFPLHAIPVEGRPAILRWPVQYVPTLSLLTLPAHGKRGEDVLLVGAPSTKLNTTELPQVEAELSEIERVWSRVRPGHVARVLVGRDQTLAEAGRPLETWSRADVLHLSCHGDFPEKRPFDAALLLGRDALRASELFSARLAASVVVLSACSLGEQVDAAEGSGGDEWIGMYLPLLYAGAQRMLVSLWEAEADPAQQFMAAFHERLSTNALPDRAVSSACGELSSQPLSFWSNWYLVGTPERRS